MTNQTTVGIHDILAALKTQPEGWLANEAAAVLGITTENAGEKLARLEKQGKARREGETIPGTGIIRYRYFYVREDSQRHPGRKPSIPERSNIAGEALNIAGIPGNIAGMIDAIGRSLAEQIIASTQAHLKVEMTRIAPDALPPMSATVGGGPLVAIPAPAPALPTAEEMQARNDAAKQVAPTPTGKPKVLVVGLLPQQAGILQAEYHDAVDLEFWNGSTGDNPKQLIGLARHADAVLLHTSHNRHSSDELIQKAGARLIRVPGGMTAMRDAITKFYVEYMEGK